MGSTNKHWAHTYINDPLTAPDPSDETGPGSHFRPDPETPSTKPTTPSTPSATSSRRLSKPQPFKQEHATAKETPSITPAETTYPSSPSSASPRHSPHNSISHRQEYVGSTGRPRRSSSLKERFPGDPSVHPLDQLAREKARADKARHTTKKHAIIPDTIDGLDKSGLGNYHHEGPYDATLFARNNSWKSSPVAAVSDSNTEALRATPHERVVDSLQRHRPLDGVAAYAPGTTDRNGQTYNYKEGDNMMTEENAPGGPYKRWPGVQYHPDDVKGKGEPSYSIEKALKDHNLNEKEGTGDVELRSNRRRSASGATRAEAFRDEGEGVRRTGSLSGKLKKRVGSLKKKFRDEE